MKIDSGQKIAGTYPGSNFNLRKDTKMKTLYIADDGTEFDNEAQCQNYEWGLQFQGKDEVISGLDREGKKIRFSNRNDDFCERVMVVKLDTEEAVDCFKDRSGNEGFSCDGITKPGIYIWGEMVEDEYYEEMWYPIDKIIRRYETAIKKMESLKNKVS